MMLLAAHDPVDHVLPHTFFKLLPFNFNFGVDTIPLLNIDFGPSAFYFTNHLLMTIVAALLCILIFPRLARAYQQSGAIPQAPKGWVNFFETLLQFIREQVARPVLKNRSDQYMPFLWTLFFFILFCNLLGMIPLDSIVYLITGMQIKYVGGTATGNLAVTGGLALCALFMIHFAGVREAYRGLVAGTYGHHGDHEDDTDGEHDAEHTPHGERLEPSQAAILAAPLYIWNFAPHVFAKHESRPKPSAGLRAVMTIIFGVLLALEVRGIFALLSSGSETGALIGTVVGALLGITAGVAAGGLHWTDLVDAVMWAFLLLLEFIGAIIKPFALMIRLFANMVAGHIVLASILLLIPTIGNYAAGVAGALGCVAISCLELFVAFLQAYIFVFLTTLFISMAVEPEH